jgi:hypothetical protein
VRLINVIFMLFRQFGDATRTAETHQTAATLVLFKLMSTEYDRDNCRPKKGGVKTNLSLKGLVASLLALLSLTAAPLRRRKARVLHACCGKVLGSPRWLLPRFG